MDQMKEVLGIIPAAREDIADLVTYRAMPTAELSMIDPFLFLNHHGPQVYPKHNHGLPFGPHPHRGFETVTFVLEGDIAHKDSKGHSSVINAGGVQWMTAGKGLVHSEESSEVFKEEGGPLEILQLWVNLPSRLKMTNPRYIGKQKEDIPLIKKSDKIEIELVSGNFEGRNGAFESLTHMTSMVIRMKEGASYSFSVPSGENCFFYVINGELEVNGQNAHDRQTVLLDTHHQKIHIQAKSSSRILLCFSKPLNESVFSYGPFVMNTRQEIEEAIRDYQHGKFE